MQPDEISDDEWPAAIRYARESSGLKQGELADRIGVQRQTISEWERGRTPVGRGSRLLLIDLFGDRLLDAPAPMDSSERSYWRGRVEQIAQHMSAVLSEQRQLVELMKQPPDSGQDQTAAALKARAIETAKRSAATASDRPAPSKTARRRHQG